MLEAARPPRPQANTRRLTAALVLFLITASPRALAAETSASANTAPSGTETEDEVIDPEEVVSADGSLEEHLTREAASPNDLCVLLRREVRYALAFPLREERVWQGCHGPDHLRLDEKRFYSLVGRDDLWRRQRGRNWAFFALDAGVVAFVIGGVTMAVYGFANSEDPSSGTWVGAGLATAIAGPSLLSLVRFALPLQIAAPEEAQHLAYDYNQAHGETARLPRPSGASGPAFAMSVVDLRF